MEARGRRIEEFPSEERSSGMTPPQACSLLMPGDSPSSSRRGAGRHSATSISPCGERRVVLASYLAAASLHMTQLSMSIPYRAMPRNPFIPSSLLGPPVAPLILSLISVIHSVCSFPLLSTLPHFQILNSF